MSNEVLLEIKNRWRWILCLLFIVVLGGVLRWETRQPEYVLRQFIRRQGGRLSVANGASLHLKALEDWKMTCHFPVEMGTGRTGNNNPYPLFLCFSWHCDNQTIAEIAVHQSHDSIISYGWATQYQSIGTSKNPGLSKDEMSVLKKKLKEFPSCIFPPPRMEQALFVSYQDGKQWKVRVYDRQHLPQSVRETIKLLEKHAPKFLNKQKPDQSG